MNTETIGMNAGAIWTALSEADAMGVKQLKKVTKLKDKELYAALGWLAREDKINIQTDPADEKEYIISLVQDK
ncbi:MAG: winged helix-turn-helix domain-containing protein [Muribaculaceae bacterium]|nr:winged helix-turn-helix domain-containing protein [Muribaculaceae bacterium]